MFFPVFESFLEFRAGDIHSVVNVFFEEVAFCFFSQEHTEAIFCIVFEEGCRPSRAVTLTVLRVTAVRCTAAPNTGATMRVGYHHAIAKELRNDFTIRCFSTTCASAGEFKQRLFELAANNCVLVHGVLLGRQGNDIIPESCFVFFVVERRHSQSFFRADMCTAAAAQAVHDGNNDIELIARCCFDFFILIAFRCSGGFSFCHQERTDSCMRTYEGALVTADTFFSIPARYEHGNATFFFCTRTGRPTAIFKSIVCTNRQVIAFQGIDRNSKISKELRMVRKINRFILCICPGSGNVDFNDSFEALIDGSIVHVDDLLAFLAIGMYDRFFQFINSQIKRNNFGQFEEGRLHDHIDTAAETQILCNADSVDNIEIYVVLGNRAF